MNEDSYLWNGQGPRDPFVVDLEERLEKLSRSRATYVHPRASNALVGSLAVLVMALSLSVGGLLLSDSSGVGKVKAGSGTPTVMEDILADLEERQSSGAAAPKNELESSEASGTETPADAAEPVASH